MLCEVCNNQQSKYKCPKCGISYCSLVCYKSDTHQERDLQLQLDLQAAPQLEAPQLQAPQLQLQPQALQALQAAQKSDKEAKYEQILQNPQMQQLLQIDALQVHLSAMIKLLESLPAADRRQLLAVRLNDLRQEGAEENVLVEEFVQTFLEARDKE